MSFHDLVRREVESHGHGESDGAPDVVDGGVSLPKLPLERDSIEDASIVDTTVSDDGTETAVLNGEEVPVVKYDNPNSFDRFNDEQRRQIAEVYLAIANLMPTEGRDYTVDFVFAGQDRGPRVSFNAKTPIGRAFISHIAQNLGKAVKK